MKQLSKQAGLSLVEIMVALVISLFLLGGIVQVYIGNKATFSFTNSIAEIQENGRFALDTMSQDLRLVDVWGCVEFEFKDRDDVVNDTLDSSTVSGYDSDLHDFLNEDPVEGENNTGLNESDTLTLRGSKPGQANVESPFYGEASNKLVTSAISTIGAGDFVLVTRCGTNEGKPEAEADIMQVNAVLPLNDNSQREFTLDGSKSQAFGNDASIIELQTVTYSIAAAADSGEPTLIRSEFGVDQELVEGVENMQILYGIDNDGDEFPNQYVSSNDVADFRDVVSLRIMLLMRSLDDFVTDDAQTYSFNGAQVTAGDRRIRQVFSATIALRNRIGSI